MGKQAKVIYTDDLTGNEIPESEVVESTLRLDGDEWKLVLTEDSFKELRTSMERFTATAMHRPLRRTATGQIDAQAPTMPDPAADTEPAAAAEPVAADDATIRTWWRGLTKVDLRKLSLPIPPPSNRGMIPAAVRTAYASSTERVPVDA